MQESKNIYFIVVIVIKTVRFIRGTVKICLEELGNKNLSAKNWLSILCSFVMVQGKIGSLSCVVLLWCREKLALYLV